MTETTPAGQPGAAAAAAGTCQWPYEDQRQCTRSPAPRRGSRGPAPIYCGQADGPGQRVHSALNAHRAKTRPAASSQDGDLDGGRAPVTEARATAASALDRAEQLHAALRETTEHLAEALADAGDPDAAAAQIAAQVADAGERAAVAQAAADRETAARLTAETRAGESAELADHLAAQTEAAEAAADEAHADADAARAAAEEQAGESFIVGMGIVGTGVCGMDGGR